MLPLIANMATTAVIGSSAPESVALTLYRAPGRAQGRISLDSLDGFGLVTESRTIDIPAGDAVLRFEGVADGIIPASAIVTGLPGGIIEKNRDARLLSPFNLIDGTLGREVTLRRTDPRTGKMREERATIVATPSQTGGGVVMRTPEGIETWRCPGVPEKLVFDRILAGLSSSPVLSVRTHSATAMHTTVTLTYLSTGFDWNASYVATVARDEKTLDLSAWATLANSNGEAFPNASVKIVAGRLERKADREIVAKAQSLELHCYPQGTTTSNLPVIGPYQHAEEIIVTGSRVMPPLMLRAPMASSAPPAPPPPPPPPPENLGDLKLYRVPQPVTVTPNAQKQVRLIAQLRVRFDRIYRFTLQSRQVAQDVPAAVLLTTNNLSDAGLGIPLPAGTTALYRDRAGSQFLLGLGTIRDTAKGEKVRIAAGVSDHVVATQQRIGNRRRHVSLSNTNPYPVQVEVQIGYAGEPNFIAPSARLERIDGIQTWRVTLGANQTADFDYAILR